MGRMNVVRKVLIILSFGVTSFIGGGRFNERCRRNS